MTFHLPVSQSADAYAAWEDEAETPRLSRRSSLLLLIATSALAYGLVHGAARLTWNALVGG